MMEKLNQVFHDPQAGTIFISLRPRTRRNPVASIACPGRVLLDLDAEGDLYGVRLLGVNPKDAEEILRRLKSGEREPGGEGKMSPPGDGA